MRGSTWFASVPLVLATLFPWIAPTVAQPITPAVDETGTLVNQSNNQFDITGGTPAGQNLFHSFEQFNVPTDHTANFVGTPDLANILGRITGGSPSLIDGLLQVSNSQANLFLMNPAGMVFGPNANLNLLGSFTATTATGIGFDGAFFNVLGDNNFQTLVGSPNQFLFNGIDGGAIANFADLAVIAGNDLNLIAGTTLNLGTVAAPGGTVRLVSVPHQNLVEIAQDGMVLNLQVPVSQDVVTLTALDLPGLLTMTGVNHASSLTVTTEETLVLSGSGLMVQEGDVVLGRAQGTTVQGLATGNVLGTSGWLETAGDLRLQADRFVVLRDSAVNPLRVWTGGDLWIQGNKGIDILALNHLGLATPLQAGGNLTLVSDGVISADSHFQSGGDLSFKTLSRQPGNIESFFDPIIRSGGDVSFGSYNGVSLKVEAAGSITGTGTIVITGPDVTLVGVNDPDVSVLTTSPALILRAGVTTAAGNNTSYTDPGTGGTTTFTTTSPSSQPGITLSDRVRTTTTEPLTVELTAPGAIQADAAIVTQGGNISITSTNGAVTFNQLDSSRSNASLAGLPGGSIRVTAAGNLTGTSTSRTIETQARGATAGSVELNSTSGNIEVFAIDTSQDDTTPSVGGEVTLTAETGSITIASIDTRADVSGNVTLTAPNGEILRSSSTTRPEINTAHISSNASSTSRSGDVTLTSGGLLQAPEINTASSVGTSGTVRLISQDGGLDATVPGGFASINTSATENDAGDIILTASGDITFLNLLLTSQNGNGGNVQLTSQNGKISSNPSIDSVRTSSFSDGGDVIFNAAGDITLGRLVTTGASGTGGRIQITSREGGFSLSPSVITNLNTLHTSGAMGGDVVIDVSGTINLGSANVQGLGIGQKAGSIILTSRTGDVLLSGNLDLDNAPFEEGIGGQLQITAAGNITKTDLNPITLSPGGGTVMESGGVIDLSASIGISSRPGSVGEQGPNVLLAAEGDLRYPSIYQLGTVGRGGDISLISRTGSIEGGSLSSSFLGFTDGGNVSLSAGQDVIAGAIDTGVVNNQAGAVEITAARNIELGSISAGSSATGGNVSLNAGGSIAVSRSINTSAQENEGGVVQLVAVSNISVEGLFLGSFTGTINNNSLAVQTPGSVTIGSISSGGEDFRIGTETTPVGNFILPTTITTEGGNVFINSLTTIAPDPGSLSSSLTTTGGDIQIIAPSIELGNISSTSPDRGGQITLTATAGGITTGDISFGASQSADSAVDQPLIVDSPGIINIDKIQNTNGAGLEIGTNTAIGLPTQITLNPITNLTTTGNDIILQTAGDLVLAGNVVISDLITNGGNLTLAGNRIDTSGVTIDVSAPTLITDANGNLKGNLTFSSQGDITTGVLNLGATTPGAIDPNLTLDAPGTIALNDSITTNGGSIFVGQTTPPQSLLINLGVGDEVLETSGGEVFLSSTGDLALNRTIDTQGGDLTVIANTIAATCPTGAICNSFNTSGVLDLANNQDGSGGNILLKTLTLENNASSIQFSGDLLSFGANASLPGGNLRLETIAAPILFDPGIINTTGDVYIVSDSGTIDTLGGTINGNNIFFQTNSSPIVLSNSLTNSSGNLSISSNTGEIDTRNVFLLSDTGDITLTTANAALTTGFMSSLGGNITLSGLTLNAIGEIRTGQRVSGAGTATIGGNLLLTALNDLNAIALNTVALDQGGSIEISSTNGALTLGSVLTYGLQGHGGNINLTAPGLIQYNTLNAIGNLNYVGNLGDGGTINVSSTANSIQGSGLVSPVSGTSVMPELLP